MTISAIESMNMFFRAELVAEVSYHDAAERAGEITGGKSAVKVFSMAQNSPIPAGKKCWEIIFAKKNTMMKS